jgi:hypothetical protein
MPRKDSRVQKNIVLSETQDNAVALAAAALGVEQAAFIRRAIARAVEDAGVDWPDDLPARGRYKRDNKKAPA